MIKKLDVFLWGQQIGLLVEDSRNHKSSFLYNPAYRFSGKDLFPIVYPIKENISRFPYSPDLNNDDQNLPCFIQDSLPDRWGNDVFKVWLKNQKIDPFSVSDLDKLAFIGSRGMGALEFHPATAKDLEYSTRLKISDLYRISQDVLADRKNFMTSLKEYDTLKIQSLFKIGSSAGGMHPKAILNIKLSDPDFPCLSGQVASIEPGYIPMIVKFDQGQPIDTSLPYIPTTRIEYSYYLMAQAAGMNMQPCYIYENGNNVHFMTERYDRTKEYEKLHTQTLFALTGKEIDSYESLFEVAYQIHLSKDEISQLFLQMAMNVLGCNTDDHKKNFSFLMGQDGLWHKTPAYDYVFTIHPEGYFEDLMQQLSVNGSYFHITKKDFMSIAEKYDINDAEQILSRAVLACSNYREYGKKAQVKEEWIKNIEGQIKQRITFFNKIHPNIGICPPKKVKNKIKQKKPSGSGGPKLK